MLLLLLLLLVDAIEQFTFPEGPGFELEIKGVVGIESSGVSNVTRLEGMLRNVRLSHLLPRLFSCHSRLELIDDALDAFPAELSASLLLYLKQQIFKLEMS
jgi:hypothetical protein